MMKMCSLLTAVCILLSVVGVSLQDIRYVRPNDDSTTSCPRSPCHSIDQYAEDTTRYFTTGSTFIFLAGNHSVSTTLNITNVHNLTLQGDEDVVIVNAATFIFNVTDFTIIGFSFVLSNISSWNSRLVISNSAFLGGEGPTIFNIRSNLTLIRCRFTEINSIVLNITSGSLILERLNIFTNNPGTAISCTKCNVEILGFSVFENNTGSEAGGAIDIFQGSLTILSGTLFISNICSQKKRNYFTLNTHDSNGGGGGAIHIYESSFTISAGSTQFTNNSCRGGGGAIGVYSGNLTIMSGYTCFFNNKAKYGGAIYSDFSHISFNASRIKFEGNSANVIGGAIFLEYSEIIGHYKRLVFINNTAVSDGGAIAFYDEMVIDRSLRGTNLASFIGQTVFSNNTAISGGAISVVYANNII